MEFVWHFEKEYANIRKHGIDLATAKRVFSDPFRIERYDYAHSGTEDRWQVLGRAGDVLLVVYTEHEGRIKIISARLAEPEERRMYYGENDDENWFIP